MPHPITCRPARPHDLPRLLEFEQGIITYERPWDPTLLPGPINYYDLAARIEDPQVEVAVAEINGKIVGSGSCVIKAGSEYKNYDRYAYLGFMYVDPDYRGRGVNKLVVNHLKNWASGRGLKEIRLTVYAQNDSALRAYEKAGFRPYLLEMRLDSSDFSDQ